MTAWALSVTPPEVLRDPRLLVFCAIGLFVPGLSRLLLILSVQKVGASRSSSIRATGPLLATLGAILWLGETPSVLNLIGILMIVTGGFSLSKKSRGETLWHRRDLIFPLAGTFLTAMRDVAVRYGLSGFPYAITGAWVSTSVSFCVVLLYWRMKRPADEGAPPLKAWLYFGGLGVAVTVGLTTLFIALTFGEVVIVSPVTGTTPLFTLMLSAVFLRDLERLTVPIIMGSLLLVAGVVLLSLQTP